MCVNAMNLSSAVMLNVGSLDVKKLLMHLGLMNLGEVSEPFGGITNG